jgi:nitrous oxidase accessory protein NosD
MRRGTVWLFAVVAAVSLCLAPAAGATGARGWHGRVLVVDEDAHHRSCYGTRRPFPTIKAALVRARAGDTIRVCPGLYEETVVVAIPRLTIEGANAGRDATGPGRGDESIVTSDDPVGAVQLRADGITWDGFTIRGVTGEENGPGMYTSPGHSGHLIRDTIFEDNGVGLHLGADGEHPTVVCRNRFVANNEFTTGGGYGVFSDEGAQRVLITENRFERHNGAGIFFADPFPIDPGPIQRDLSIDHNTSIDDVSFATIFGSSRVRLTANKVKARVPAFLEPASAIFIGARNDDVVVLKNKVTSASGNGIDVTNSGEPKTDAKAPTNVVVRKNKVAHAQMAGIHLGPETAGTLVERNQARDNHPDCKDVSTLGGPPGAGTAGTANTWRENVGATPDPPGICGPPVGHPDDHGTGHGRKHKQHHKKHKKHRPDPCACREHPTAF